VNDPHEYDIALDYKSDVEPESVTVGELRLIRAYLPDILKELAMLTENEKE
jgi:hypothetical protein